MLTMKSAQKLAAMLKDLHTEAMQLKNAGRSYSEIAQQLELISAVSRDLCRQLQKHSNKRPRLEVEIEHLPNRVVQALLHGEYAALVSRDFSMRAQYLAEIASLHTRDDLLSQDKIGPTTVAYVEEWLASKGRRLRRSDEDIAAIVCNFKVKKARPLTQIAKDRLLYFEITI
jgi:hypothetical protein